MVQSSMTLEREGLLRLGDETLAALVSLPPEPSQAPSFTIRMTSGTTGRAAVVIANEHKEGDARGFEGCNALLICMGGNNTRLANMLLVRTQSRQAICIMAIDDADVTDGVQKLLDDFRPDCFRGFTSFVSRVGSYIGDTSHVKRMKLSGEKWTPTLNETFTVMFPNAFFEILYITNEIGVIATRACPDLAFGHFHPAPGVHIDIVDTDESGIGDILVTKDFFRDVGVSRYRVGDIGRADAVMCACGNLSFELVGRKGSDYIKVAGAVLLREEFDRVAALCRDLFEAYRAEAATEIVNGKQVGHIALTVYRSDAQWSTTIEEEIRTRFSDELFLTPTRTLAMLIQDAYFLPLTVRRAAEPFPRKNKEVTLTLRPDNL